MAVLALDPGAAAMQLGKAAHEGEPQPRPTALPIVTIVHLAERLEDLVQLVAWDARAVVLHRDLKAAAARPRGDHGNPTAFRRELHRIGNQVDEDLLQRPLV